MNKELRALLEFIKECYPICDLETFTQRVVSRLSKIVPSRRSFRKLEIRGGGGMLIPLTRMTPPTTSGVSPSLAVPGICQLSA